MIAIRLGDLATVAHFQAGLNYFPPQYRGKLPPVNSIPTNVIQMPRLVPWLDQEPTWMKCPVFLGDRDPVAELRDAKNFHYISRTQEMFEKVNVVFFDNSRWVIWMIDYLVPKIRPSNKIITP